MVVFQDVRAVFQDAHVIFQDVRVVSQEVDGISEGYGHLFLIPPFPDFPYEIDLRSFETRTCFGCNVEITTPFSKSWFWYKHVW